LSVGVPAVPTVPTVFWGFWCWGSPWGWVVGVRRCSGYGAPEAL
jgi:hypothetical protein